MERSMIKKWNINLSIWCLTLLSIATFVSCDGSSSTEEDLGNWVQVSDFDGVPRADAVAFTIGSKAYLGTGYDGEDRLNDFWEYDPATNYWQQRTSFPGTARNGAVGFGSDTKGYIGLGYDGYVNLPDFYEYDPISNTWAKIQDFGGTARYGAVSFCINNIGYVGTGYDETALKDFWKYDPSTKEWSTIVSIGGTKRRDAASFVINGKGYVVSGVNNGKYVDDFWAYDPSTGQWEEKRKISDSNEDEDYDDDYALVGCYGVGFTMNGKGYLALSGKSTANTNIWEYNPTEDLWDEKYNFEGNARIEAVGFSVNNRGFVGSGRVGSEYYDDFYEFFPDQEYNKND